MHMHGYHAFLLLLAVAQLGGITGTDAAGLRHRQSGSQQQALQQAHAAVRGPKGPFTVNVTQAATGLATDFAWPEFESGAVSRGKTGLAFSGGGSRAYSSAYGSLRALQNHKVLSKDTVSHIAAVSGGSWVTSAYTYNQNGADDEELLPSPPDPASLSMSELAVMDDKCLGNGATQEPLTPLTRIVALAKVGLDDWQTAWAKAIASSVLAPYGLDNFDQGFTLSQETADAILAANPSVGDLILPTDDSRPFHVSLATLTGVYEVLPLDVAEQLPLFYPFEFTPLASGWPIQHNLVSVGQNATMSASFGGLVETFAFNCQPPDSLSFATGETTASVQMDANNELKTTLTSVGLSAGTSSNVPAYDFQVQNAAAQLVRETFGEFAFGAQGPAFNYFLADDYPAAATTHAALADGGYATYNPIHSLIARGLTKIVAFHNDFVGISPTYDPTQGYVYKQIASTFAALFGMNTTAGHPTWYYETATAVFSPSQYAPVVQAMQASQAAGNGAFWRGTLTTVANERFSIPAGLEVDVAFFYLADSDTWRAQLPNDTQTELNLGSSGAFPGFPFYATTGEDFASSGRLWSYTPEQVNLLSGLTSWVVEQNWDKVSDLFLD